MCIYEGDTIKDYYENLDTSFQYFGEDVEFCVDSQYYRVPYWYECGREIYGVHPICIDFECGSLKGFRVEYEEVKVNLNQQI